jgi:TPR repeat protein
MADEARKYHCSVTYERRDALDASSFFAGIDEQGRGGWRVAAALFGIALFAMGIAICFVPPGKGPSKQGILQIFVVAAVVLSWSVDPAFRDFTRRLWLPRGRALALDFSDAGVTIERNVYGSKFTAWSDVASVTERADGILLVFKGAASPVPGMSPLYRRLTSIIGSPILWLPTRTFVNDEAKWELRDFARQFVPQSTEGDTSFFRVHIATLMVMILVVAALFAAQGFNIQEAQYRRGLRYLSGDGVIRDDARGVHWITTAATHGYAPAQYELGVLYTQGTHGVSKNFYAAVNWFREAADAGLAEAQDNLGMVYEGPRNGAYAERWYRLAAEQGYAPAQNNLGRIYFYGFGVARDEKQAAYWCQKAAEAGFGEAQNNLGTLYMTGRGVPRDNKLAERWFRKAADQGFPQAKINLSILLGEPRN